MHAKQELEDALECKVERWSDGTLDYAFGEGRQKRRLTLFAVENPERPDGAGLYIVVPSAHKGRVKRVLPVRYITAEGDADDVLLRRGSPFLGKALADARERIGNVAALIVLQGGTRRLALVGEPCADHPLYGRLIGPGAVGERYSCLARSVPPGNELLIEYRQTRLAAR